ncbi:MAG: glycosyltransferase [Bacteroidales bacterium]|nr:glycosyltransferase [Bacteroidales bacterium]
MIDFFQYIFIVISLVYVGIIISFTIGWFGLKIYNPTTKKLSTKVSVIIATRNEEENIQYCLNDLIAQDFDKNLFEIIIVDDFSADKTILIIESIIKSTSVNIELYDLKSEKSENFSKKTAIQKAIEKSNGELIITTDADCRFNSKWISTLVDYYENSGKKMISGPVSYCFPRSFLGKFQTLEFLSLISSGAGAISIGKPIMCNGANFAYSKTAFYEIRGFEENMKYSSGDDVFLLQNFLKTFGSKSIGFLKNKNAIVYTKHQNSVKGFFNQRIRWTSKSSGYKNFFLILTAFSVLLFNLSIISSIIIALFYTHFLWLALILFAIKSIADFPLLFGITYFTKQTKLLFFFLPLQIFYPFYISFLGILGNLLNFNWKGRELKK